VSNLGDRFVAQARTYAGVPYYHAGRSRQGLDCIGLLAVVAHDLGITDHDDVNYSPDPEPGYLTATLHRFCDLTWINDPFDDVTPTLEPGDLLQFEIAGVERHAGIYAEDERGQGTVIHAYQSAGKVCEHLLDRHWQRRLWAAYRLKEPDAD
jgi:cell wall-associated NlpC family hydrolase